MNRIDFFVEWYHKENDRQISLNESLNIPVGVLTGLLALFFIMFTNFSFDNNLYSFTNIIFVLLMALSLLFWVLVVFYLFKSYNNLLKSYVYKGMPYPTDLNLQYEKLKKYVDENKGTLANDITPDSLYEEQMIGMISEYLNRNIENNDKKSRYLHIAKKYLLICIISTILSSAPFIYNFFSNRNIDKIEKVEIKNIKEMSDMLNTLIINNHVQREKCFGKTNATTTTTTTSTTKVNNGR